MRWSPLALPDVRDQMLGMASKMVRATQRNSAEWVENAIEEVVAKGEMTEEQAERARTLNLELGIAIDMQRPVETIKRAELTWVTREMSRLALDSSHDIPAWSPAAVCPFPYGILVWEGGMPAIPYRGMGFGRQTRQHSFSVPVDGIMWSPMHSGAAWSDTLDNNPDKSPSYVSDRKRIENLGPGAITLTLLTRSESIRHLIPSRFHNSAALHTIGTVALPGAFGGETTVAQMLEKDVQPTGDARIAATLMRVDETYRNALANIINAVGATWSLMLQPKISNSARQWHDPDPNRKNKPPRKTGEVTIIDLRPMRSRPAPESTDEFTASRQYTCRWVVRGHWRQQVCGPNNSLRRPTWIASYIAGPEHMPLRITEHVHVWRR